MQSVQDSGAKERILKAALGLFSEKGYDGTSVSEIAAAAHVTKALIYYYFKNKEEILDSLFLELFQTLNTMALEFVNGSIVGMIHAGKLDIESNRFVFTDKPALDEFYTGLRSFVSRMVGYAVEQRHILRILSIESLKNSSHHDELFRILDMTRFGSHESFYQMIRNADSDFTYSDDMDLFKLYFLIFPIISFASYLDDYSSVTGKSEQALCESFLRMYQFMLGSMSCANTIQIRNDFTGNPAGI